MQAYWEESWAESEITPDRPAAAPLEAFCEYIDRLYGRGDWTRIPPDAMAEGIAGRLREEFDLVVPIAPRLLELLQASDIELTQHDEREQPTCFDWNAATGQWQIWTPHSLGRRQSVRILQGLFLILFWRMCHRTSWWNRWRAHFGVQNPQRLASCFAFAVVLPPSELRDRASACGLNIWQLADTFAVTPSACYYGLRRYVRFAFPYFLARLDFNVHLDQLQLFFDASAVRARVWAKFLAQPCGSAGDRSHELEALQRFPRRESVVEVKGKLLEAIHCRRPMIWKSRHILGVQLPQPACFVARPNSAGTQLLVQSVPLCHHPFLMDRMLQNAPPTLREF